MSKIICFAGLLSEKNLGDIVIIKSTKGLYKEALKGKGDFKFEDVNLQFSNLSFFTKITRKLKSILYKNLNFNNTQSEINLLKKYYKSQIENSDLLVLVGGGLIKYKYQGFFLYLTALIEVAEEMNIPLIINAAGVEGYSDSDVRCQLLKKSLNSNALKSVTTRDDIETLANKYIYNNETHIAKVADSAVYCDEVYQEKKKQSIIYGIGLVRGGIFQDNERDYTPENTASFYAQLITEMENRGHKYQLFTNGYSGDNELLELILNKLNRTTLSVIEPKKDSELVEVISHFSTVIAARLHANIISYSLNIPSIGLVWNDKLKLFGEDIGYPERFFEYSEFDVKNIIDAAELANTQGYEKNQRDTYRLTAKENIDFLVKKWLEGKL